LKESRLVKSFAWWAAATFVASLSAVSPKTAVAVPASAGTMSQQSYFCTVGMRYGRNANGVFYISSVFQAEGDPRVAAKAISEAWIAYVDDTFAHGAAARGDECRGARDPRILEQPRSFFLSAKSDPDADPVIDTGWAYAASAAGQDPGRAGSLH
jgi:hypothetical protein